MYRHTQVPSFQTVKQTHGRYMEVNILHEHQYMKITYSLVVCIYFRVLCLLGKLPVFFICFHGQGQIEATLPDDGFY